MQIVFDIVNPSTVTNDEIKSTICAMLCHEILVGREIPQTIHLKLVKHPIRRDGRYRTGELKYVVGQPDDHIIRIAYENRTKAEILLSVFHEVSHLLRVYNNDNHLDYEQEERDNQAQMIRLSNLVEWVSSVLVVFLDGNLGRLHGGEKQS